MMKMSFCKDSKQNPGHKKFSHSNGAFVSWGEWDCHLTINSAVAIGISVFSIIFIIWMTKINLLKMERLQKEVDEMREEIINLETTLWRKHWQIADPGIVKSNRYKRSNNMIHCPQGKTLVLVNLRDSLITRSDGIINHWILDTSAVFLQEFQLVRRLDYDMVNMGSTVRIKRQGVFIIQAQLYFESRPGEFNQFSIEVQKATGLNSRSIATCSTVSPVQNTGVFDLSCFTSVIVALNENDGIFIKTNEVERRINTEIGKSFFGLVRIS